MKTCNQVEALKEETNKSLKEKEGNKIKQVKELNKVDKDLKVKVKTIKKTKWMHQFHWKTYVRF